MDAVYFTVPAVCVLILGLLLFLLIYFHRTKKRFRFIVTVPVTIAFLLVGGFLSWRFTEIALYPKITINGQPFVFEGHRYLRNDRYDPSKIPYAHLKLVAYEQIKSISAGDNLFHYIFFPYCIYVEDDAPAHRVLWEHGLMFDAKYVRAS